MTELRKRAITQQTATTGFIILLSFMLVDVVCGASIKIAWNANQESDLSGYKVYYGASSGNYGSPVDVGNVTTHELTRLNAGEVYYIALTAYDTSANESAKSAEIYGTAESLSTTTVVSTTPPTSTVPPTTTTTTPLSTTTTPAPPQPASTSTTVMPSATTTTALLTTTSTAQPSSSTSSILPITTTTTIASEALSSCNDPVKLQPLSVTASNGTRPFFPAENLIDGNAQTAWSTLFTFLRKDTSITLDMGSDKIITSLSMHASRLFGIDFLPSNIELQTSNDNHTWETISAAAVSAALEPSNSDSWQINNHTCRYIKLRISGRKGFFLFQLAQIAELEIYGCNEAAAHLPFSGKSSSSSNAVELALLKDTSLKESVNTEPLAPGIPGKPLVTFK